MKSLYLFVCLFVITMGYTQNSEIKMSSAVIPSPYYYCEGQVFDLEVADYASNSVQSSDTVRASNFNHIFNNASGEKDIEFEGKNAIGNQFSKPIELDFAFNFFGKTYTRIVIGTNGRLVFTNDSILDHLNETDTFIDRTFLSPAVQLPSPQYNQVYASGDTGRRVKLAQIFAGFTNLKINNTTTYFKQKKFNTGSNKGILITFQSVLPYNPSNGIAYDMYTSRVILFDDGRIVFNILNKTSASYNAVLGMQNEDGDKAIIAGNPPNPAYNNGRWTGSSTDAFVITTGEIRTPRYLWQLDRGNDGSIDDDTNTTRFYSNYQPTSDLEKLSVKITFAENTEIKTSQVLFKKLLKPQISAPDYTAGCGSPAKLSVINPDPELTYRWRSEADSGFDKTGTSITVGNGKYYVQVHSSDGSCTEKSGSETVFINSNLPPFISENQTIPLCDSNGNPSKTFDLAEITEYPAGSDYTVEYFEEGSATAITSANFVSGQTKNFTIKVATKPGVAPACSFTKSFSIAYLSFPQPASVYISEKLCVGTTAYSVQQFENKFFPAYSYEILFSVDGTEFTSAPVNPSTNSEVWVKLSSAQHSCSTTVKLKFDFHPEVKINSFTQFPEHCTSSSEYFDLNITKAQLEYHSDIKVSFYKDKAFKNQISDLNYRGSGIVYIKVENIATGCVAITVPELHLRIYQPPTLLKNTPETKSSSCGSSIFNLTTDVTDYIGSWTHYSEIRYYDSTGNRLKQTEWENYDLSVHGQPYMIFVYNETNNLECSNRIEFNLIQLVRPVANVTKIPICSESTYTLQDFTNKVIANAAQYTFTAEDGGSLPLSFDLTVLPKSVRFFIKDNMTDCISELQTVTFIQNENSPLNATESNFEFCDTDFDGKTEFDLNLKKEDFTNASATFEYFKDAGFTQSIPAKYTNETPFAQTVYVRITIPGYCPSSAQIHLVANTPTRSSELLDKYSICFGETLSIDAGSENDSVIWSDGQTGRYANFSAPGAYSVTLKNGGDGCAYTHDFVISDENQPKINLINQTSHSIEVIASGGRKPYTYYFNGQPQPNNVLSNPTELSYKIQVQSADGCFGPPQMIYFVKINNAFTPNGDGINDTWKIEQLDKMQQVSVVVIDRHGTKVFESTDPKFVEWDGQTGGKPAPTGTYWYFVSWYDAVTQKSEQRQGWLLLKNRR